jgi:hypothetical protein
MYNVKHSKSGKFNAKVNRLPIGSYELGVIFPKGMSVYPHNATGMTYTGRWMKGYNSYWFKKDGWFVGSVKLKVPVKFKAGYGSHGIITAGGFSNGVLGSIMTGISGGIGLLFSFLGELYETKKDIIDDNSINTCLAFIHCLKNLCNFKIRNSNRWY